MEKKGVRTKLIVFFVGLFLIGGCTNPAKSSEEPMVIYCMEASELSVKYYIARFHDVYPETEIEVRVFEDAREMDEILVKELNVGIGPDIVIFNDETELDVLRMAKNGAFIALDEMMAVDTAFNPDDYIKAAIDAGRVEGRQYLLPLTFTIPFVMYDADGDLGFTPAPIISHADFMESVIAGIEKTKYNQDAGVLYVTGVSGKLTTNDLISPMLLTSQVLRLSEKNKVENLDAESFKKVVDWLKIYINECYEKSEAITDARGREPWVIANEMQYFYFHTPFNLIQRIWYYNSCYGYAEIDHFGFSAFSEIDSDDVVAMLVSYGVIGNNAHPLAYEFLRMAMDTFIYTQRSWNSFQNENDEGASSVKLSHIEMMIETRTWGPYFRRMPDNTIFNEMILDEDMIGKIYQILANVNRVIIPNAKLDNVFRDSFTAYFENEKSYEECAGNFIQKLNLYLSE